MKNIVWKNGSELPPEKREQIINMLCDEIKKRYCFLIIFPFMFAIVFLPSCVMAETAALKAVNFIIVAFFFASFTGLILYKLHKKLNNVKKTPMMFCSETVNFYSPSEGIGRDYREPFVITSSGIKTYIPEKDKYTEYKKGEPIYCIKFNEYIYRDYNTVCIRR